MVERRGAMETLVTPFDFWRGKRVFITGHTGFKGTWLTILLHRLGAKIAGYSDGVPTRPSHFELAGVGELLSADYRHDIRDLDALTAACSDFAPSILFHLAAQPLVRASIARPVETFAVNVMGTVNCLEAVRAQTSLRAAVIVTSDKVYKDRNWEFGYRETDTLGGNDPYSGSKACTELVVSSYRESFGLGGSAGGAVIASARAGNVVGGGDFSPDRLVPDLVRAVEAGGALELRYPGATRPWQHVADPLLGYLRLAQAMFLGETHDSGWNFGPPPSQPVSVEQFIRRLTEAWGISLPVTVTNAQKPRETLALQVDSTKAAIRLGWHPSLSFDLTLDLTAQWYRAYCRREDMRTLSRRQADDILRFLEPGG